MITCAYCGKPSDGKPMAVNFEVCIDCLFNKFAQNIMPEKKKETKPDKDERKVKLQELF